MFVCFYPVLLVHDYSSDPGSMQNLKQKLENDGFQVFISDYSPEEGNCDAMGDIKWYSKVLKIEIRDILQETGANNRKEKT